MKWPPIHSKQRYALWGEVRWSSGPLPTDYILPRTQDRLYTGPARGIRWRGIGMLTHETLA
ncbi:MAG: hypothetical protein HUU38_24615 [Anaerolineales bacterium]|nr:hypothetical protein [Anaerolineales bacterium]